MGRPCRTDTCSWQEASPSAGSHVGLQPALLPSFGGTPGFLAWNNLGILVRLAPLLFRNRRDVCAQVLTLALSSDTSRKLLGYPSSTTMARAQSDPQLCFCFFSSLFQYHSLPPPTFIFKNLNSFKPIKKLQEQYKEFTHLLHPDYHFTAFVLSSVYLSIYLSNYIHYIRV